MNWLLFNTKKILEGLCNYCKELRHLKVFCSCKYSVYCSTACKSKDKFSHKSRCPNEAESDEEDTEMKLTEHSNRGRTGLRNLGNTCFMNSGLQCISHIKALTEYFISSRYVKDINKENPLGTRGELSTAFAKMVQNLWFGKDSSFAPTQLKKAIGKYQPMFSGYNQHDSS
jgi:ubiquitin carboxyl-terminal hydrolase 4/11/15